MKIAERQGFCMNISTTFLNALRHTSSDVEGQRSPEILLGQIYKVSLEDKSFYCPWPVENSGSRIPFYYEWNPFPSYLLLYTLEGSARPYYPGQRGGPGSRASVVLRLQPGVLSPAVAGKVAFSDVFLKWSGAFFLL
ncbi:MAG: hypothetical protein ACLR6I_04570 [Waltera sp.]